MQPSQRERLLYGQDVQIASRIKGCNVYRIEDKDGLAVMTRYEVFPGIAIVYNDIHRQEISLDDKRIHCDGLCEVFEINHCSEGRIEFESIDGNFIYLKKGDLSINTKEDVGHDSYFPLSHYHGISIEIDLEQAPKNLSELLDDVDVDLIQLRNRFCEKTFCAILREKEEFEHLFSELYHVPAKIQKGYFKVKVLEILLFLSEVDTNCEIQKNRYYNRMTVELVKKIRNDMVEHLDEKITISELSKKYKISLTMLKECFREIYGKSLHMYLKEYRIHRAAELIQNTEYEIGQIASMVGYDNASKFAESFKRIIGINPSRYRKELHP